MVQAFCSTGSNRINHRVRRRFRHRTAKSASIRGANRSGQCRDWHRFDVRITGATAYIFANNSGDTRAQSNT